MADKAAVENNSPKAEAQVSAAAKPKTRAPRKNQNLRPLRQLLKRSKQQNRPLLCPVFQLLLLPGPLIEKLKGTRRPSVLPCLQLLRSL